MIKAFIFDYYGVLTTDRYFALLQRNPDVKERHPDEIESLSKLQDDGIEAYEFFGRQKELTTQPITQVKEELRLRGLARPGLFDYIHHLRDKNYKTAILSNSSISLYDEIRKQRIGKLFDAILCSEEAGVTKPNPKIFELILSRLGVEASEALFVDDHEYNVRGAEAIGIESVLYSDLAEFKTYLYLRELDSPQIN